MIEEILGRFDLNYEELNVAERETFNSMVQAIEKNQMTPDRIREFIQNLKAGVETELANEPEFVRVGIFRFRNDKNILLKARLRNYMLIESFLETPEKAKQALDRALAGMVQNKGVSSK